MEMEEGDENVCVGLMFQLCVGVEDGGGLGGGRNVELCGFRGVWGL